MEKRELFYVAGEDYHVWERLEELFNDARFDTLEELIDLEPITIQSIKISEGNDEGAMEAIENAYDDLVKWISDEDLYLVYYSNQ